MSRHTFFRQFCFSVTAVVMAAAFWSGPVAALENLERYLFVPNRASADVAVIDRVTERVIARLPVGKAPHQVVVSRSLGKLVASNTEDDTITIVDLRTLETEATLALDTAPEHMALGPDGQTLAVGNIGAGTVSLVSLRDNREVARIAGLIQPHNLTFGPKGKRLYVANLGANYVSVIDVARARITGEIPVADPGAIAAKAADPGAGYQGIINVTATPDGRLGFAAHGESGALAVIDLDKGERLLTLALGARPWRAYGTADGRYMVVPNNGDATVSVISTATLQVVATLPGATGVTGVNSDATGKTVFVISRAESKVVILDLESLRPAGEIALPGAPETGVLSPRGDKLYVALSGLGKVAVIDVPGRRLSGMIEGVGREPWGTTLLGADNYCH